MKSNRDMDSWNILQTIWDGSEPTPVIQCMTNCLKKNSSKFGLRISNEKNKGVVIGEALQQPVLEDGQALESVDSFYERSGKNEL